MKDNPYVGPRPYGRQDRHNFYGRTRDARALLDKIMAERVVLFYAQSGAGKSSLLNAQVIPELEAEGFDVLPIARVGNDLPPQIDPRQVDNVFIFSTLLGLVEPETGLETLTRQTLLSFLRQRCPNAGDPDASLPILVWDQFEEIFTTHRQRWQERRRFFEQVRGALDGMPSLGVVFVMREDHVAAMDTYAYALHRQLRARFRMERLGYAGALEAVKKPAQQAGCPFDDGVAEKLVDNLRRIRTLGGGVVGEAPLGPYVEPVQLQVVCSQLWENLPEQEDNAIQWTEVEQYGNIDRALTDFYESALARSVRESGVSERDLRCWFEEQLITPMQTRGLALRGQDDTGGLPNTAVDVLEAQHIIRAEARAGARWYELAHDRLVDPVVQSNRAWEEARETPLRATARRWRETGDAALLYRDKALARALAWAEANPDEVEPYEQEFLVASRQTEQNRVKKRRQTIALAVTGGIAVVIMAVLTVLAVQGRRDAQDAQIRAERQARRATAGQLAAQAQAVLQQYPSRSLLYALEAIAVNWRAGEPRVPAAENVLRQALSSVGGIPLIGHKDWIYTVAFSPDGRWLATGSKDGTVRLWDVSAALYTGVNNRTADPVALLEHEGEVTAVVFSPDGYWLATGSADTTVRLWDASTVLNLGRDNPTVGPVTLLEHEDWVNAVAFSPDGRWLATGSNDEIVRLWDVSAVLHTGVDNPAVEPVMLYGHEGPVKVIAFSPDGRWLATGSNDATVRLWDVSAVLHTGVANLAVEPVALLKHEDEDQIRALAFSPDGRWLASGSLRNMVRLWDVSTVLDTEVDNLAVEPVMRYEHGNHVFSVVFSPDGRWLASGSWDNMVRLWEVSNPMVEPATLSGHEAPVNMVAFSPDGRWLATGSKDGTARLWEANNPTAEPVVLHGHDDVVYAVTFSPDGRWLTTGSLDNTARLWEVATALNTGENNLAAEPVVLRGHEKEVWAVAFRPDGRWLATGSEDHTVRLWDVSDMLNTGVNSPTAKPVVLRGHDGSVESVAFGPGGRWLATGSADKTVRLWNVPAALDAGVITPAITPTVLSGHEGLVRAVAFSPDGNWLATGSTDHTVRLWDVSAVLSTGVNNLAAEPVMLYTHGGLVRAVAFSPAGDWLATGSRDTIVRLWDVATVLDTGIVEPVTLREHEDSVESVTFSPDGRWLATGSGDHTVRLWDVAADLNTGDNDPVAKSVLRGHEDWVASVAFDPDGRWLATGSYDIMARLWDISGTLDTGINDLATDPVILRGHEATVYAVAFSPDGRWLATGSTDSTVRLWTVSLDELVERACYLIGRNLTYDEWRRYHGGEPYRKTCPNLPAHPSLSPRLVIQAEDSARNKDSQAASEAYQQAIAWAAEADDVSVYDVICRSGNVRGFAEVVLPACERAAELSPDDGDIRDSRGLARALTGDTVGAIEDFWFAISQWKQADDDGDEQRILERETWITELEAGRNPFDADTLEALRSE